MLRYEISENYFTNYLPHTHTNARVIYVCIGNIIYRFFAVREFNY